MSSPATMTRDTYWDTVKAILIFLVILGHVVQLFMYMSNDCMDFWSDPLFKGIYIFHMPLFMLISGFFAAKSIAKHGRKSVIRYLHRLALPCVGMGLIYLTLVLLKVKSIWSIYSGYTALWFLIVVFECVVFYIIMQWKQAWWYKTVMFILPIPLAILCGDNPYISKLFPHTDQFTYLWPFFVLGTCMSHVKFSPQHIDRKWIIFPILYVAACCLFHPHWYVYRCSLGFDLIRLIVDILRTLAAIVGCGTALWAGKYLHSLIGEYVITQNIGQATLAIYVLQPIFFDRYKLITSYLPQSPGYIGAITLSFIILAVLYLIYVTTRHIPFAGALLYGETNKK